MENIIYRYHASTGELMGQDVARESPREPGIYLVPANATQTPPPADIPAGSVAVFNGEAWSIEVDNRGLWYQPDGTSVTISEIGQEPGAGCSRDAPPPVPPTIPELISLQLKNINAQCEQAIAQISEGYPPSEVLSWPKQETEARAWLADNNKATPLIDSLSSEREVAKAELIDRIIDKADAFAVISGQLIGKRQRLEDQLMAMKAAYEDPELDDPTPAEIEAVVW